MTASCSVHGALQSFVMQSLVEVAENAEAERIRERIADGDVRRLDFDSDKTQVEGLCRVDLNVDAACFVALQQLHKVIKDKLGSQLTGWGGLHDVSVID